MWYNDKPTTVSARFPRSWIDCPKSVNPYGFGTEAAACVDPDAAQDETCCSSASQITGKATRAALRLTIKGVMLMSTTKQILKVLTLVICSVGVVAAVVLPNLPLTGREALA